MNTSEIRQDEPRPDLQDRLEEVRFWQASLNYNDKHGWEDIEEEAHELSIFVGVLSRLKASEGISYRGYEEYCLRHDEVQAEIDAQEQAARAWAEQLPPKLHNDVLRYLESKITSAALGRINLVELKARFEEFCESAQVCALDVLRARAHQEG